MIADDFKSIADGMKKDAYDAKDIIICPWCENRAWVHTNTDICPECGAALKRTEAYYDEPKMSDIGKMKSKPVGPVKDDYTRILPYYDAMVKRGI